MQKILQVFLVVLLVGLCGIASAAPIYTTTDGSTGNTYEFYFVCEGINWTTADALATSMGGTLAIVDTALENTFVANELFTSASSLVNGLGVGPWLGGFSANSSTPWQWVDGSAFSSTPSPVTPWNNSQPDWYESGAQGLLYYNVGDYGNLGWGDYGQLSGENVVGQGAGPVMGYIVEYAPVPEPSTLTMFVVLSLVGGLGYARKKKK